MQYVKNLKEMECNVVLNTMWYDDVIVSCCIDICILLLDRIVIFATCVILWAANIYIILLYIITTLVCLRVASLCISLRYDRSGSVACMRYDTIVSFWWNCIMWIAYLLGLVWYYYIIMIILYWCRIDERKKYALVVEHY